MRRKSLSFWAFIKFIFISCVICGIVLAFKYPDKSKFYAKKAYYFVMNNDSTVTIPLETDDSGMFYVTAKLNDVPIRFILDTGCSTMLISSRDAEFLLHHKIVNEKNIIGNVQSVCANGSVDTNTNININKVELNGIILNNIPCMVSNSSNTPLLLGQAVLSQMGRITIDYNNKLLIINK